MATIKSYTDISQSKKLAEILPLESADMYYWLAWSGSVSEEKRNTPEVGTPSKYAIKTYWCPCWSLASLINVLPTLDDRNSILCKDISCNKWHICYRYNSSVSAILSIIDTKRYDNPIDACYEMILKLNELNLL